MSSTRPPADPPQTEAMTDKPTEKAYKAPTVTSGAESPTTARELDFDDDGQDTSTPVTAAHTSKNTAAQGPILEEAPPPQPPRPKTLGRKLDTLIEMFPLFTSGQLKGVLDLNGENETRSIEYLLDKTPTQVQSELDWQYAHQLAEEEKEQIARSRHGARGLDDPRLAQRKPSNEREHSFFDDDLPVIQEHLRKVYNETESTVTTTVKGLFTNFKNMIDGKDDDEYSRHPSESQQRQNFGSSQSDQLHGIHRNAERSRPSRVRDEFDPDPRVLDDNFTSLRLEDNDTSHNSRSNRPLANPDLFKPTPSAPQKGPVDEVEALYRQPTPTRQPSPGAGKTKKWQPLTSVAPNPEADDHDPFSLGDSDDEDTKTKDIKADDTERLKRAAADSPVSPIEDRPLEAAERSGSMGTRNKEAEEILSKDTKT